MDPAPVQNVRKKRQALRPPGLQMNFLPLVSNRWKYPLTCPHNLGQLLGCYQGHSVTANTSWSTQRNALALCIFLLFFFPIASNPQSQLLPLNLKSSSNNSWHRALHRYLILLLTARLREKKARSFEASTQMLGAWPDSAVQSSTWLQDAHTASGQWRESGENWLRTARDRTGSSGISQNVLPPEFLS